MEEFIILWNPQLFLLKSLIQFSLGRNTLHGYSQSDHHLTCVADIHRSDLIYFQVCHMLKILPNKSCLKHCIFHWRMLHLVFSYNHQYLISWNYVSYHLVLAKFFLRNNTWSLSPGRFALTKYTAGKIHLIFNSEKIW